MDIDKFCYAPYNNRIDLTKLNYKEDYSTLFHKKYPRFHETVYEIINLYAQGMHHKEVKQKVKKMKKTKKENIIFTQTYSK